MAKQNGVIQLTGIATDVRLTELKNHRRLRSASSVSIAEVHLGFRSQPPEFRRRVDSTTCVVPRPRCNTPKTATVKKMAKKTEEGRGIV